MSGATTPAFRSAQVGHPARDIGVAEEAADHEGVPQHGEGLGLGLGLGVVAAGLDGRGHSLVFDGDRCEVSEPVLDRMRRQVA